eukprot:g33990.t1
MRWSRNISAGPKGKLELRAFGTDNFVFHFLLSAITRPLLSWDEPFEKRGKDARTEVESYCHEWSLPLQPWVWSKSPSEYRTMNEWFSRRYATEYSPEKNLGSADCVSPCDAVVEWYPRMSDLPIRIKNEDFTLAQSGIPAWKEFSETPAAMLYLSPADYHCFHAPCDGKLTFCKLLDQEKYSVTVKSYIWRHVNILSRNRRAVMVLDTNSQLGKVAMIVIGGITVDSIRLAPAAQQGRTVAKGEYVGAFARGGSAVGFFFFSERAAHPILAKSAE